jgi:hypothetical protein
MADFAGRWTVSQTAGFQQRVLIAAMQVAITYTAETAETVIVDQKRRALAVEVFDDPLAHMVRFAVAIAARDVGTGEADAVLEQNCYELWDNWAGINADEYAT